jgi:alkylation response protein AidB-like acyl-CoA dehydrogenase
MKPICDGSESLDEFRSAAAGWLAANQAEAPRDYGAILPPELAADGRAWQRRIFDAGFAGLWWPEQYGGRGLTHEHQAVWQEECARAAVPPFLNMVGIVLAGGSIQMFGGEAQKAEHLRAILTGERIWCQLFSEPGAGSDLASLTTRAEPDDSGGWRLHGQKVWCSNGRVADWGICMARTDPDAKPHRGISFFLVDMSLGGIDVRPLRQMTGESEFDEVFLDGVAVGPDALLGPLNEGWKVGMATLTNERGHIGASAISLERRVDALLAAARSGIASDGRDAAVARDELLQLWCRGQALLALARRQGPVASVAASLLKLGVTDLMFDAAMAGAALDGAAAMLDGASAHSMLAAPAGRIAGGTTQIQKNIIGERILGLPR